MLLFIWFFVFFLFVCSFALFCRPWHTSSDSTPDHQWCAWQLLPGEDCVPALHRQLQPSCTIHLEAWEHANRTEQRHRSGHLRAALHSGTTDTRTHALLSTTARYAAARHFLNSLSLMPHRILPAEFYPPIFFICPKKSLYSKSSCLLLFDYYVCLTLSVHMDTVKAQWLWSASEEPIQAFIKPLPW